MIHLKKSRCGYKDYICTGIPAIPVLQDPVCDNIAYDNSPQSDREKDNNFLNLPQRFKGIVQSTTVLDLSGIVFQRCIKEYNPLQEDGLLDAFKILAQNSEGYLKIELTALDCFGSDSPQQPVGILLPSPDLSAFNNIPTLAVPTVALPSQVDPQTASRSILSGCRGLAISAKKLPGSYRLSFSVSAGKAYLQNDQEGQPQSVDIKAVKDIEIKGQKDGQKNASSVDVYIVAQYDIPTRQWKAIIDYTTAAHQKQNNTPTKWIKRKHLGTIKYNSGRIIDVIQAECGPVDMRDWTSQQKLPARNSGGSRYVMTFGYKGNSAQKGWIQVKDCG